MCCSPLLSTRVLVPASVSEGGIPCVCAPPVRRSRYLVATYSDYETIAGAFSERYARKLSSMDNSHFFVYLSAFLPLFALLFDYSRSRERHILSILLMFTSLELGSMIAMTMCAMVHTTILIPSPPSCTRAEETLLSAVVW